MSKLKELKEEFKNDPEFILEGFKFDLACDLKTFATEKGLTYDDLEKRTGFSKEKIEEIFSGEIESLEDVAKMCAGIGLDNPILVLTEVKFVKEDD